MIMIDVQKQIDKARADGKRFLLVCADTMDRIKGDRDLGYYYPAVNAPPEVITMIANHQLGEWDPNNVKDHCEAIIELREAEEPVIHDPAEWLARQCESGLCTKNSDISPSQDV